MNRPLRLKDHWAEQRQFLARTLFAVVVIVALLGLLVWRLVALQIFNYQHYSALSQGNRIRLEPVPPTRGLIYDRNGILLAENLPAHQLELTPEQVPDLDDTLKRLEELDLLSPEDEDRVRELVKTKRRFDAIPVRYRLTDEEVARFAVNRQHFQGVDTRARLTRHYPFGKSAVHAVGYVGSISEADLERLNAAEYAATTHVGKVGVERAYERTLHGEVGHRQMLVNAQGRVLDVLDTGRKNAVPGEDLYLGLDIRLQLAAEEAMGDFRGAVVAVDPDNGDLLAFVSTPSFDPNPFGAGLSREEFRALQTDIDRPLFNRALRGQYPPGSTIKPVVGLAGLDFEAVVPEHTSFCRGFYTLPEQRQHKYRDWKKEGHGKVDLHDSIVQSCDVYFYELAVELGIDRMSDYIAGFGLGRQTGIDVPNEKAGILPSRDWKRRAFSRRADKVWFKGETVITGIGQGYMLTTPVQLAHMTATLAAKGRRYSPRFVTAKRQGFEGDYEFIDPRPLSPVSAAAPEHWDEVLQAMEDVVNGERGTARAISHGAEYRIAGKTGTAQVFTIAQEEEYDEEEVAERLRHHALFVAYAPAEDPTIALAVIVENGGGGSTTAAPVARAVLDVWFSEETL